MQSMGKELRIVIDKNAILPMLIAFYIVFFSDSFYCTTMIPKLYEEIFQWSLVVFSILLFLRFVIIKRKVGKDFFVLVFVILTMLASMIVNSSTIGVYFYKIAVLIFGFCYSKLYSLESFLYYYKKIMYFLIVVSLVFYIWYLIGLPVSFLPTVINNKGNSQYSILFSTLPVVKSAFVRIKGPFWEPGVYATYLVLALFFDLIIDKKKDIKYLILIFISLILTFSTTGYFAAMIVIAGYVFEESNSTSKSVKALVVVGLLISIILVLSSDSLYSVVFGKIESNSESMKNRWNVISGNLEVIKRYPFLGAGPSKSTDIIVSNMTLLGSKRSFSNLNTVLANYSVFGVSCALYYVYFIVRFVRQVSKGYYSRILLFLAILILLSCFGFQFSLFYGIVFMLEPSNNQEHILLLKKMNRLRMLV